MFTTSLAAAVVVLATFCVSEAYVGPQQVHIAGTDDTTSVVIMWASPEACNNDSMVYYGLTEDNLNYVTSKSSGQCVNFTYGNSAGLHYIHTVTLNNLQELTRYYYVVSSYNINSSITFNFKTLSSDPTWMPNIMIFGDLGHKGGELEHKLFTALPAMTKEVQDGKIDLVIHMGDFAYNLDDDGGERGDEFFRNIQNISAYVPYMVCVGNHEWAYNASNFRTRFRMPNMQYNDGFNMWYSLDVGRIHFIFLSTEVLFQRPQDESAQYAWLEQDLIAANNVSSESGRKERPWIVTIGHRPMYCSNADDDCISTGSAGEKVQQYLESLFYKYGVDIELWAHEHSYERTWPVYNFNVTQKNYINPKAPVHLITGAAGCNESNGLCLNPILRSKGDWSAYRTMGVFHPYSYGHMVAFNDTVVYWDQVNAQLEKIYDSIYITQTSHGPY